MKKHQLLIVFAFCLATLLATAQNDTVVFSARGGFYDDTFSLELYNAYSQNHIRYTVNGNRPTAQSPLYTEPLLLDTSLYSKSDIYTIQVALDELFYLPDSVNHCIVIRAAVFDENDSCVSNVTTQSYFIRALEGDTHGLPAVSISADSLELFGFERGILVPGATFDSLFPTTTGNYWMRGREWERVINVEYYDYQDNGGINQTCGVRTHGNRARLHHQKGLKIYAREEYGKKRFKHQFFEESPLKSFKHLVLKPYSTLFPFSGIQDWICGRMALGIGLEAGLCRPVCLFINGEFWGIYFLQEKMDERFLEDHFDIDIEHCNIISNWHELECGRIEPFQEMMDWLETADLSTEENYHHINELVDIDNFIDYIILETFIANNDWPGNNSRCWQMDGGKWRWIFFDGDAALNNNSVDPFGNPIPLDVFGNATYSGDYTWPASRESTLLFRRLFENWDFYLKFDHRLRELCQTSFLYENTVVHYLQIFGLLAPMIEAQSFRYGNPSSEPYWLYACMLTDDFLKNRVDSYLAEWETFWNVPEYTESESLYCYPNPSSGELHLCIPTELSGNNEIAIYDLLGRKVFSQAFPQTREFIEITINPALSPGVYILKMNGLTQRIVRY